MTTFNLIDDSAIPVLRGELATSVSLGEALLESPTITDLVSAPPTMGPALFRHLLLAIHIDAIGYPRSDEEWMERWGAGAPDRGRIEAYLAEHRHRFDLFSETEPFAQVPGLQSGTGEAKGASHLIPSQPVGNNVPIFGAVSEAVDLHLTPAEAARWLIHLLAWDTAGIKTPAVDDPEAKAGKLYGNPTGPLGSLGMVIPKGRNLFETLMLNTPVREAGDDPRDLPHWRRPQADSTWRARTAAGPVENLTWLGRRVRLIPAETDDGVRVTSAVITGGDRLHLTNDFEFHTAWRKSTDKKTDEQTVRPQRHIAGRNAWQGLPALLAVADSGRSEESETSALLSQLGRMQSSELFPYDYPLTVDLVATEYGTQSAVVNDVFADSLPLPIAALRADAALGEIVENLATSAGDLVDAINSLHGDLRRAAGGDPIPWNSGQRPGTVLVQRLDPVVRQILAGLQREPERDEEARALWFDVATRIVNQLRDELVADVPPSAHVGRAATVGGKERMFRAATAEMSFGWRRNKALIDFRPLESEESA